MPDWRFSGYANRLTPSAIRALADRPRAADTIAFGPGEPDAALFPLDEIRQTIERIVSEPASARRALRYVPGRAFFYDGAGANTLRLSYSSAPLERIAEGVARLTTTIRAFS